jgi:predicted HTH domain antitoxin
MCRLIEELVEKERAETRLEERNECALRLLSKGNHSFDEIAEIANLSVDEVKKLASESST